MSGTASAQPVIQVRRLVKRFGPKTVLRGLDLEVRAGEFLALLGPNGAGKTTLLRILASLSRPTAGEVRIGGYRLPHQAAAVRRRLGVVSHQPLLYGDLSAEENLRFYARLYGLGNSAERIEQVLDLVGLGARRRDLVRTYSRGMQQRLAIARALLHDPEVLLLDEPYTGLDQDASAMLDSVLRQVAAQGRTVVMTSHDLSRAAALATRFAVLSRGRIVASVAREQIADGQLLAFYRQAVEAPPAATPAAPPKPSAPSTPPQAKAEAKENEPPQTPAEATPQRPTEAAGPAPHRLQRETPLGRAILAVLWKDLAAEFRSRELLSAMLVFALLVILIFNFALELAPKARLAATPGVLWVTLTFAGTLGLNRSMATEKDRGCLDGLLLAPVDRSAIYFGKALSNLAFMLVVAAIVLPLYSVLYNLNLLRGGLLGTVLLGSLGYIAVGTLLAAMAVQARTREMLLPILLFPVIVPALIAAVKASGGYLQGLAGADIRPWLNLLVAYDLVFTAIAYMVFDYIVEE